MAQAADKRLDDILVLLSSDEVKINVPAFYLKAHR